MGSAVVAIDVGGTTIKAAVVTDDGQVRHRTTQPSGTELGPAEVVTRILGLAAQLQAVEPSVRAAGVVVPGLVDSGRGVARTAANLGWRDVPLAALVTERLGGLPVHLDHDVRAGALAEARVGAGRGTDDFLFLAIGTGIAGAVVLGSAAYAGAHGAAGEIGHVTVTPGGLRCGCGGRGCLETYASAESIRRRYCSASGRAVSSAADVIGAAKNGDAVAARVWDDALEALAVGIALYVGILDPELVVLGGGLSLAGADLIDPLADRLRHRLTLVDVPELRPAELGAQAGCLGAALLAFDSIGVVPVVSSWSDA